MGADTLFGEVTYVRAPDVREGGLGGSVAKFVRIGEFSALDGVRSWRMNDFKGRHFDGEMVLWPWRW